jgi:NAD(P)-dependent dehydrogenase (short-subunit alcohol dehydrogenase family)
MSNQKSTDVTLGELRGQVAFVTGAASGMGKAIALDLAKSGARVWGVDTSDQGLVDLKELAKKSNLEIWADKCDIASQSNVVESFEKMNKEFGRCSILVTAAGIGLYVDFLEMSDAEMRKLIDVNFIGSIYCAQEAIKHMKQNGGGKIVFVSSVQAELSLKGCVVYAAQKAALNSVARTLVLEVGRDNIRVNTVSPGTIDTPMLRRDLAGMNTEQATEFLRSVEAANVIGKIGTPEEVAEVVHYLVSDHSTYVTGTDIIVDGGFRNIKKF